MSEWVRLIGLTETICRRILVPPCMWNVWLELKKIVPNCFAYHFIFCLIFREARINWAKTPLTLATYNSSINYAIKKQMRNCLILHNHQEYYTLNWNMGTREFRKKSKSMRILHTLNTRGKKNIAWIERFAGGVYTQKWHSDQTTDCMCRNQMSTIHTIFKQCVQ